MFDEVKMPFYAFLFFICCMAWTVGSIIGIVGMAIMLR